MINSNKDEMIMGLVHYFVTEENYTPISVHGVKNEIWLENLDAPYKIIRINSKYIHNDEQFKVDIFRMQYVIKQIKKKTMSLKMNALNICLDMNSSVKMNINSKVIDSINVKEINDFKNNFDINKIFPKAKDNNFEIGNDIMNIINITEDINKKTQEENSKYENVFQEKPIIITKVLIIINIFMYIISLLISDNFNESLYLLGANNRYLVLSGEVWRLLTCAFLHGSLLHLVVNMYSLWIVGSQVEKYIGRIKYIAIYLLSALMGSMFSILFLDNSLSVGASGAIFGLMGSLLYFGYHYRLYLSNTLIHQLVPLIIINLVIGFSASGIDNWAHIGGLIGGYLSTMMVGLKYKSTKSDIINGTIVYTILFVFLIYAVLRLV